MKMEPASPPASMGAHMQPHHQQQQQPHHRNYNPPQSYLHMQQQPPKRGRSGDRRSYSRCNSASSLNAHTPTSSAQNTGESGQPEASERSDASPPPQAPSTATSSSSHHNHNRSASSSSASHEHLDRSSPLHSDLGNHHQQYNSLHMRDLRAIHRVNKAALLFQ